MTNIPTVPPLDALVRANPRIAPDTVWEQVRAAYSSGVPAAEACRRYGVGLSALRTRAARDGWRRADQPWMPPDQLDPWDEGVALEERVHGDLDHIEYCQLSFVCDRRMMRAVLRGQAAEALRWGRVRAMVDEAEAELERMMARDEAARFQLYGHKGEPEGRPDSTDSTDCVSEPGADRP